MKPIVKHRIASVEIIRTEISSDEISVLEAALNYALEKMDASEIEQRFGSTRDGVEAIRDDLHQLPNKAQYWWQTVLGKFANDDDFEEAMRLGREYRESQRDAEI